jgi:hypothetical protein
MATFDAVARTHHTQLARGRTLARSARVRDFWVSPGLAGGEVVDGKDTFQVTVRVRVFEDSEWRKLVRFLLQKLDLVASLLQGELPEELVHRTKEAPRVLPKIEELDASCPCDDYRHPCAHAAAVHNVLAEALDGEPFLLLTLRGLTRDQLLTRLRKGWGDPRPFGHGAPEVEDPPWEDDWAISPIPLLGSVVRLTPDPHVQPGVKLLGPPLGEFDLVTALEPLYESGSRAALDLAFSETGDRAARVAVAIPGRTLDAPIPHDFEDEPLHLDPDADLSERLVDLLAGVDCAATPDLADQLGVSVAVIRRELLILEQLGIVYRTGHTRATRWWLG